MGPLEARYLRGALLLPAEVFLVASNKAWVWALGEGAGLFSLSSSRGALLLLCEEEVAVMRGIWKMRGLMAGLGFFDFIADCLVRAIVIG